MLLYFSVKPLPKKPKQKTQQQQKPKNEIKNPKPNTSFNNDLSLSCNIWTGFKNMYLDGFARYSSVHKQSQPMKTRNIYLFGETEITISKWVKSCLMSQCKSKFAT